MDEISDEDKLHFYTVVLPEKQKFQTKEAITKSWDRFKAIEKVINPELHNLTDNAPQFKQWHQKFQQIVSQLDSKDLISSYANYDTKLDTESDDEYNARNSKLVDPVTGVEESDQDFINRKNNRVRQIEALNDQKDAEWVNNIMQQLAVVGNQLDPIAAGTLKKLIPKRIKDVLARKIQLALMAGMSLASCQSSEDITYNSGFIKEKTTIDLWTIVGANNQTQLNNYIEKFKKLEPNVKINNVKQSTNYNGLASMASDGFATNNYPDLIQAYPDAVSDFMYYKKVVKLDSYMDNHQEYSGKELAGDYKDSKYEDDKTYTIGWSEKEKADIVSEYLAEGQKYVIDGTYSVPFSKSTEAMFYNRDLLGKSIPGINGGNGLTEEYFNNLTWEELFDNFCPKFIEWNDAQPEGAKLLKSDQAYHAVFAYDSDDNLFITLGEQYGIPYTGIDKTTGKGQALFNNAEYKALLKKWNEYAKKGYIISKGSCFWIISIII